MESFVLTKCKSLIRAKRLKRTELGGQASDVAARQTESKTKLKYFNFELNYCDIFLFSWLLIFLLRNRDMPRIS